MYLVPTLLGAFTVIQAGLNRKVGAVWGLPIAVLLNALVLTTGAAVLVFLSKNDFEFKQMQWWFVLPGLLGLGLVFGGPWCVQRLGAVNTFVLLVSAQLLVSVIWDIQVEQRSIHWARLAGLGLAWVGAVLASVARN